MPTVSEKGDINNLVWPKDGNRLAWLDRLDKIIDAATKLGIAYAGINAIKHPMGAVVGLVAYRLAQSNNVASGAVGSATLAGIGLLNYRPSADVEPAPKVVDASHDYPFESWLPWLLLTPEGARALQDAPVDQPVSGGFR